ncbi:hypothetical protein NA57DRAFT_53385 [Rhizodiscina lignyota]|uniref:Uncharacterized protein n=1 Tax=Rhizodiscina lignyota TaxID=1504668 RepID=A0A9P4IN06_9PEZI|nr:hypothetical protein NA57DRAFT_53385 [Rhizodiscina lignyota]
MSAEEGKQAYADWAKKAGKNPEEKETWTQWIKSGYAAQYENWMPWIEDQYLKWFSKDNKASYAAKDNLDKTKVTNIEQVDKLQGDVNNLAAGQVGKGGLLQPVGDLVSREGVNRAERGGKDDKGNIGPGGSSGAANPVVSNAKAAGEGVADGAKSGGAGVWNGAKSAGGYVGSFTKGWGGKKEQAPTEQKE